MIMPYNNLNINNCAIIEICVYRDSHTLKQTNPKKGTLQKATSQNGLKLFSWLGMFDETDRKSISPYWLQSDVAGWLSEEYFCLIFVLWIIRGVTICQYSGNQWDNWMTEQFNNFRYNQWEGCALQYRSGRARPRRRSKTLAHQHHHHGFGYIFLVF